MVDFNKELLSQLDKALGARIKIPKYNEYCLYKELTSNLIWMKIAIVCNRKAHLATDVQQLKILCKFIVKNGKVLFSLLPKIWEPKAYVTCTVKEMLRTNFRNLLNLIKTSGSCYMTVVDAIAVIFDLMVHLKVSLTISEALSLFEENDKLLFDMCVRCETLTNQEYKDTKFWLPFIQRILACTEKINPESFLRHLTLFKILKNKVQNDVNLITSLSHFHTIPKGLYSWTQANGLDFVEKTSSVKDILKKMNCCKIIDQLQLISAKRDATSKRKKLKAISPKMKTPNTNTKTTRNVNETSHKAKIETSSCSNKRKVFALNESLSNKPKMSKKNKSKTVNLENGKETGITSVRSNTKKSDKFSRAQKKVTDGGSKILQSILNTDISPTSGQKKRKRFEKNIAEKEKEANLLNDEAIVGSSLRRELKGKRNLKNKRDSGLNTDSPSSFEMPLRKTTPKEKKQVSIPAALSGNKVSSTQIVITLDEEVITPETSKCTQSKNISPKTSTLQGEIKVHQLDTNNANICSPVTRRMFTEVSESSQSRGKRFTPGRRVSKGTVDSPFLVEQTPVRKLSSIFSPSNFEKDGTIDDSIAEVPAIFGGETVAEQQPKSPVTECGDTDPLMDIMVLDYSPDKDLNSSLEIFENNLSTIAEESQQASLTLSCSNDGDLTNTKELQNFSQTLTPPSSRRNSKGSPQQFNHSRIVANLTPNFTANRPVVDLQTSSKNSPMVVQTSPKIVRNSPMVSQDSSTVATNSPRLVPVSPKVDVDIPAKNMAIVESDSLSKNMTTPESARDSPAKNMTTAESARDSPAKNMTTAESARGSPAKNMGTPGSARGSPAKNMTTPESARGSPAKNMTTPESARDSFAKNMATPESARDSPAKNTASLDSARDNPVIINASPKPAKGSPVIAKASPKLSKDSPKFVNVAIDDAQASCEDEEVSNTLEPDVEKVKEASRRLLRQRFTITNDPLTSENGNTSDSTCTVSSMPVEILDSSMENFASAKDTLKNATISTVSSTDDVLDDLLLSPIRTGLRRSPRQSPKSKMTPENDSPRVTAADSSEESQITPSMPRRQSLQSLSNNNPSESSIEVFALSEDETEIDNSQSNIENPDDVLQVISEIPTPTLAKDKSNQRHSMDKSISASSSSEVSTTNEAVEAVPNSPATTVANSARSTSDDDIHTATDCTEGGSLSPTLGIASSNRSADLLISPSDSSSKVKLQKISTTLVSVTPNVITGESEYSVDTPRRSSRRKSCSYEPPVVVTPQRKSRRSVMATLKEEPDESSAAVRSTRSKAKQSFNKL